MKGFTGLANLGNTCYLNAILQILSHTYEWNAEHYVAKIHKTKVESLLLQEWMRLRALLWANNNQVVSPDSFVSAVQHVAQHKGLSSFAGFEQNDSSEFLVFLLDCFHIALTRKVTMTTRGEIKDNQDKIAVKCFAKITEMYQNDYSEVWKLFYGLQISHLENANTGEEISLTPEPFFILNLSLPSSSSNTKTHSLLDCLDLYVQEERIEGVSVKNTHVPATKKLLFWSFPDILVIDLKRSTNGRHKKQQLVSFPLENLDLSSYVVGYNKESFVYDLYGVCNHHGGSVLGGHYTAFVKTAANKWYHFNDTSVVEVADAEKIVTSKAYCFFYRRRRQKT